QHKATTGTFVTCSSPKNCSSSHDVMRSPPKVSPNHMNPDIVVVRRKHRTHSSLSPVGHHTARCNNRKFRLQESGNALRAFRELSRRLVHEEMLRSFWTEVVIFGIISAISAWPMVLMFKALTCLLR